MQQACTERLLCAGAGNPAVGKVLSPGPLGALRSHVHLGVYKDIPPTVTGLQAGNSPVDGQVGLSGPAPATPSVLPGTKLSDLAHSWGEAGRTEGVEQTINTSPLGSSPLPECLPFTTSQ